MINNIKVYGERNSGTHYVTQLLEENIQDVGLHSGFYKDITGWKHGYPKTENYDIKTTLFIFLIRDINPWLKSMYKNPYSYNADMNIEDFFANTLVLEESYEDHDVHVYEGEQQNILDIRYMKIKAYIECYTKVPHAILINLDEIQTDYNKFLLNLHRKYNIKLTEVLNDITLHTKTYNKQRNRIYDIELPYNIISSKINHRIEKIVFNLKSKGGKYKTTRHRNDCGSDCGCGSGRNNNNKLTDIHLS